MNLQVIDIQEHQSMLDPDQKRYFLTLSDGTNYKELIGLPVSETDKVADGTLSKYAVIRAEELRVGHITTNNRFVYSIFPIVIFDSHKNIQFLHFN